MTTRIIFDPALKLSSSDFADAWNDSPKHRDAAAAHYEPPRYQSFDPALADAGRVVLEALAMGLLTNAVWDLVKELLFKQGVRKKTTYQEITQPDGTQILIITVEEE